MNGIAANIAETSTASMTKRYPRFPHGPHMIYTEAQSLDEALRILDVKKPRHISHHTNPTLKQELSMAKGRARSRSITLSDRVTKPQFAPPKKIQKPSQPVWDKERVIKEYKTLNFTPGELARMAKVSVPQIKRWIWGDDYIPRNWTCKFCPISMNHQATCRQCKRRWGTE